MKRPLFLICMLLCCAFVGGCGGGREIEEYLFPVMIGLDAAGDGDLLLTVKALSGNQGASGAESSEEQGGNTGYITLSATGKDYVQALMLLGATVPRTLNLSQLREVVISETLARSRAVGPLLNDLLRFYQADGNATLLVCAGRAQDVLEKQQAYVGTRISQYLEILFKQYQEKGIIPHSTLLSTYRALCEPTIDPVAVYVAVNAFDASVPVPEGDTLDTLPGHLDRSSPNPVEYLGSAVFANGQMSGVLTGAQTQMLRLLMDDFSSLQYNADGTEYLISRLRHTKRQIIDRSGSDVIYARLCLIVRPLNNTSHVPSQEVADALAKDARALLENLQSMGADAVGFGRTQILRHISVQGWEKDNWSERYRVCDVQIDVQIAAPTQ